MGEGGFKERYSGSMGPVNLTRGCCVFEKGLNSTQLRQSFDLMTAARRPMAKSHRGAAATGIAGTMSAEGCSSS